MKTTRLIIVVALALTPACVSKKYLKTRVAEATVQAAELQAQIAIYRQRLERFNQVNPDGSLR